MGRERIEKEDDPRLEPFRDVRDPEWLRARGLFLAEGRKLVDLLARAPGFRTHAVLATPQALAALREPLALLPGDVPVYEVTPALLREVAGVRFHQGCVAAGLRLHAPAAAELIDGDARRVVVLERLSDPDNVGSIFRSALAFGVDALLLSPGCASPLYRKALRTSMGASLRIPFAQLDPWPEGLEQLHRAGFELLALSPDPAAPDLDALWAETAPPERVALLLGSEGEGLSTAAAAGASRTVRIAMDPRADSLNVATAAAIALHRVAPRSR